eukprot:gene8947-biopygen16685
MRRRRRRCRRKVKEHNIAGTEEAVERGGRADGLGRMSCGLLGGLLSALGGRFLPSGSSTPTPGSRRPKKGRHGVALGQRGLAVPAEQGGWGHPPPPRRKCRDATAGPSAASPRGAPHSAPPQGSQDTGTGVAA